MVQLSLLAVAVTAAVALAAPSKRACLDFILISTRGTGEPQGPSEGFITMIANVLAAIPNGQEQDTVYPADIEQDSAPGTADIISRIQNNTASCPDIQFALLGYSQGATATVDALKQLGDPTSGTNNNIKAVFLIGDPEHEPGKQSNVDQNGGNTTDNATGIEGHVAGAGIPDAWDSSGRVLDVCFQGDGVCSGFAITEQHLLYGTTASVQNLGTSFLESKLT